MVMRPWDRTSPSAGCSARPCGPEVLVSPHTFAGFALADGGTNLVIVNSLGWAYDYSPNRSIGATFQTGCG
jgi:hypothetical protein